MHELIVLDRTLMELVRMRWIVTGLEAFKSSAPEPSAAQHMAQSFRGLAQAKTRDAKAVLNVVSPIRQSNEGRLIWCQLLQTLFDTMTSDAAVQLF